MTLLLDPDIRDWVLLPLFAIMVGAGLLRHYSGVLLQGQRQKAKVMPQRVQNLLRQTAKIRSGASHYVPTYRWFLRKQHYIDLLKSEADWCLEEDARQKELGADGGTDDDDPMSAMMNPMGMLKGNMAFMVQNMVMMQGIQHFFSGFILLKVPFPLTTGFKNMFQRGLVELPDLEPSYVSSVSWYFLVMYGLRSFLRLAIGDPTPEMREQDALNFQLGTVPPTNNPQQAKGQDAESLAKQLRQEAENMDLFLHEHKSELDSVERRLLGKKRYPKKKFASDGDDDFLLDSVGGGKKKSPSRSKKGKKIQ